MGERRAGRRRSVYVDRYGKGEWMLILFLLALSAWDTVFTVMHLARGGQEMNPLMELLVGMGNYRYFAWVKLAVTVSCLACLLIHIRFRIMQSVLHWLVLVYCYVLAVHVYNSLSSAV
ncbi:MAG: hypothetical protein HYX74_07340 [Acidobacteria bacterium]|nr:hypothetical protein [Acidobacteriota bacterium]